MMELGYIQYMALLQVFGKLLSVHNHSKSKGDCGLGTTSSFDWYKKDFYNDLCLCYNLQGKKF